MFAQRVAGSAHIHQSDWERVPVGSAAGLRAACFEATVRGFVAGHKDCVDSHSSVAAAVAEACFVVDTARAVDASKMGCKK